MKIFHSLMAAASPRKTLKVLHLMASGLWIGGTAALTMLICLYHPATPDEFGTQNTLLMLLDYWIIAPGAVGCLVTGLVYSLKYNYGFFRFRWVTVKLALNLLFIIFGGLVVVPWLEAAIAQSASLNAVPQETTRVMLMHLLINAGQWATIIFVLVLSVFKPWGRNAPRSAQAAHAETP